jgi:hypothetical protein
MKKLAIAAALASVSLAGCATYPNQYGGGYQNQGGYYDQYGRWVPANSGYGGGGPNLGNAATGAAVGAIGGAVAGKVIPGVSTTEGAIAGAILGGVLGAVVNNRQYYRDTRGYCYYVDQYGQPHYDYQVRC